MGVWFGDLKFEMGVSEGDLSGFWNFAVKGSLKWNFEFQISNFKS
jgi:hypothetical protein